MKPRINYENTIMVNRINHEPDVKEFPRDPF